MDRAIEHRSTGPSFELCWGTVQRASLLELLQCAEGAGFASVAVQPGSYLELPPARKREARQFVASSRVRVKVVDAILGGLPGSPSPAEVPPDERAGFEYTPELCFDVAQALRAPIVNVAHYRGTPVGADVLGAAIQQIAAAARTRELAITVEFIPGTGIGDLAAAEAVIAAGEPERAAIMLDSWHLARSGGSASEVAALPPGAIGGLQLSDRIPPPAGTPYRPMQDRLLPGQGELPLRDVVAAALANSPEVAPSIEVFSATLRALPLNEAAAVAAASLRELFEQLGQNDIAAGQEGGPGQ